MNSDNSKKILLTGAGGLVGSRISKLLQGRDVTHFELSDPGDGFPCIEGNLCDAQAVEQACRGMDAVIHVAGLHGKTWADAGDHAGFEMNVMGTQNILEGARKGGVSRVVFTSSLWAAGHLPVPPPYLPIDENLPREPFEIYGLTKKLGEQMCRYATERYGLSTICLRPGGIQPEDAPFERKLSLLLSGIEVRDVARAHVMALDADPSIRHETLVIGPDNPLCGIHPTQFFTDPLGCLDELFPGIRRLLEDSQINVGSRAEWCTYDKAKRLIGYNPEHNFELPQS